MVNHRFIVSFQNEASHDNTTPTVRGNLHKPWKKNESKILCRLWRLKLYTFNILLVHQYYKWTRLIYQLKRIIHLNSLGLPQEEDSFVFKRKHWPVQETRCFLSSHRWGWCPTFRESHQRRMKWQDQGVGC